MQAQATQSIAGVCLLRPPQGECPRRTWFGSERLSLSRLEVCSRKVSSTCRGARGAPSAAGALPGHGGIGP